MRAARMLIATAAALAATAFAQAQDPDSTPKADPPAEARTVRIIVNEAKDDAAKGDGPAVAKPRAVNADPGGTRRMQFIRLQDAIRAKEGQSAKGQTGNAAITVRATAPADDHAEVLNRVIRLTEGKANDPHREILLKLKAVASESCVQCHAGGVSVRHDEALGLSVVPADETLRSQLKLDGKGLVVTAVEHGTPGDAGGVKEKDIVIVVAGKPVATVEDFQATLKGAGVGAVQSRREPITVKVVRAGEAKEIKVPPPGAPSLKVGTLKINAVRHQAAAPSYWIGVSIGEVDDTLRTHLKLEDGAGLVVTDVMKESPAAKVKLEKNDLLLTVDGKPLKAPEDLVKSVQAAKDEATLKLGVRRAGDRLTVAVRPEKRKETEVAASGTPLQGYTALKLGEAPQEWIAQVMPFLNDKEHPVIWATPGQPGPTYLLGQPSPPEGFRNFTFPPNYIPLDEAQKKAAEAEMKKVIDAVNGKVNAEYVRALSEWTKKAAVPAESLAKIDAQLKALEAQVGEIKRSMDDLKAAIKKDSGR